MPRATYDRLTGSVRLVARPIDPALVPYSQDAVPEIALVPDLAHAWRIEQLTRGHATSSWDFAQLADAEEAKIQEAAGRLGLLGRIVAVDEARAGQLLARLRDHVRTLPTAPFDDPLIVYPPEEDPRPMWKTHVTPEFMTRDAADRVVECLEACVDQLRTKAQNFGLLTEAAPRVAATWSPPDGAAGLFRAARAELPAENDKAWWLVIAMLALISRQSSANARLCWLTLGALVTPLLALAGDPSDEARDRFGDLRGDLVRSWRDLAREVAAWQALIAELEKGEPSPPGLRAAVERLRSHCWQDLGDIRHSLHDLSARDVAGIRNRLEELLAKRLAAAGFELDTPYGALIGVEATLLLSLRGELTRGAGFCRKKCGRSTKGEEWYCKSCRNEIEATRVADWRRSQANPSSG